MKVQQKRGFSSLRNLPIIDPLEQQRGFYETHIQRDNARHVLCSEDTREQSDDGKAGV